MQRHTTFTQPTFATWHAAFIEDGGKFVATPQNLTIVDQISGKKRRSSRAEK